MSFLLEYRKINDVNVPLYFKFGAIPVKDNLTADKLMTLENWMHIFDELNPLLASDPNADPKKRKTFEMDSGRLSVKARWAKISDTSDMGTYIVKILNLSSSNVGKYFLKIDVKLSSYLERIASELEQKSKSYNGQTKPKEPKQDSHSSSKTQSSRSASKHKTYNHRKISDMLPTVKKEPMESPTMFNDTDAPGALDDLNSFEEYIPEPSATSSFNDECPAYTPEKSCTQTDTVHSEYLPISFKGDQSSDGTATYQPTTVTPPAATYYPEKKLSQIEMNKVKSEYSPPYVSDQSKKDDVSYKPTTKGSKSAGDDRLKKVLSKELFGSSDENDNVDSTETVSSSSQKSKRRMDVSPRRERKSNRERSKLKKKKYHDVHSSQDSSRIGDISLRSLKNESVDSILATYPEHEDHLTGLYEYHIKQLKRNYKPVDIPDMAALDIVSTPQFTAMISLLESKLVRDAEEEHNYSDVIFDLLIPEWALAIFCKKFRYSSRTDALDRLREQSEALSNCSQL